MASKAELALILSLVDDVSKTAKDVKGQLEEVGKSGAGLDKQFLALGGNVNKFVAGTVAGMAAVGVAIIAGIGAAAFKAGMEIDEAFDNIIIKTGAMGEDLESLKGSFKVVFGSFPANAQDVSDAIAGLNQTLDMTGPDLERLTTGILSLSKLTKTDASANVTAFSRVMGDWGVSNEMAQVTLDQLFKTTQLTGVGIEDLMSKVVQFGSPLRLMGFSLEESMIMFGKFAKEGVNAELVMGSMRIAAGKFAKAGQPLRESLLGIFDTIKNSTDASAALALGMEVFGAKAGPDMTAAIREGRFSIEELTSALDDSTDALEYTITETMDFGEKLQVIKNKATLALEPIGSALMDVAGKLIDSLMPAFDSLVGWITDKIVPAIGPLIEGLTKIGVAIYDMFKGDWSGAASEIIDAVVKIGAAFGLTEPQVRPVMEAIIKGIADVVSFVRDNKDAILGAISAIGATLAAAAIASQISSIVDAITSLTSPLGIILAAIALLGAAWAGNWGGIQEKTQAVIDWLTPYVNGAITAITTWWAANGATIIATVVATWEWIKATFQAAVDIIQPIVSGALNAISAWWDVWGGAVMTAVQNVWNFIVNAFKVYFDVVKKVVETVWAVIQAIWEQYGSQIMQVITNVWEIIKTVFSTAFTFVKTLFEAFVLLFNGDLQGFAMKVTEAFIGLWEGVKKIVSLAWENIKLVAAVAMDALGLALTAAWTWIKKIFTDAWNAIVKYITDSWEAFKTAVSTIVTNVIAFFTDTDWAKVGSNIIGGIVAGISSAAQWLWDTVTGLLTGLLDKIKEFFGIASPSKLMASMVGEPLIQGIGVGMAKAMKMLESAQLPDMTARLIGVPAGQLGSGQSGLGGMQGQPVQAGNTYNYNNNLTISTSSRDEDIIQDFAIMNAMAGA